MKNRISFDFDDTLSEVYMQSFAKICIKMGYEVWIVTSRVSDEYIKAYNLPTSWNDDLWLVTSELGIPRERVKFTSYSDKADFFLLEQNHDFIFHTDDDAYEIRMIKAQCPHIVAVNHLENVNWRSQLSKLINR